MVLVAETGDLQINMLYGDGNEMEKLMRPFPARKGVIGAVLESGVTQIVPDNRALPHYISFRPGMYLSSLVVPLIRNDRVIGALNVESRQLNYFTPAHAAFVGNLAKHAVISIGNAQILDQQKHQVTVLSSLQALTLRLSDGENPEIVGQAMMEVACQIFDAQGAAIFNYDEAGVLLTQQRFAGDEMSLLSVPPEEALEAAQTGEMQIVQHRDDMRTIISIPLPGSGRRVLCMVFAQPRNFRKRDLETLELVANQAGGYLENAILAKQLADYRDEITHMIVHDLRGPLGSIVSGMIFALDCLSYPSEVGVIQKTLQLSIDSANSLINLVNSILDIAKLENRQLLLQREPNAVRDIADSAFDALATVIQKNEVRVDIDIPDNLAQVSADSALLRRVLINLLDNAVRFTPPRGNVRLAAEQSEDEVIVRVSDSGPGIPPEERERVFEKFRQVKGQMVYAGKKGSGLGLTFCKLAVEAHGGRIWVEEHGVLPGASFALSLPVAENTPQANPTLS
jgi:signal transduction histidine kinase